MGKIKHLYPGANTCLGFYSLYDYMAEPKVQRKIILKGGPGVGKSTFMKKIGEEFSVLGFDIEYHWCSSDNSSLDGVVIGQHQVCILDGTAPHIVDPRFPGAVDEIINLGEFWDKGLIEKNRAAVIKLTQDISRCFERAYLRLKEAGIAYEEWKSYYTEVQDRIAVNRNIMAISSDFLQGSVVSAREIRHLFAGAITPGGLVTQVESIIENDYSLFGIKGSPGSGIKLLFDHTLHLLELNSFYAEVYHNPFDPREIDIIVLPESKAVLVDISSTIFNYAEHISTNKYKRLLDFDQLIEEKKIDLHAKRIFSARNRFENGLDEAIDFIKTAKKYHDELESFYVPAMDFEAIQSLRHDLLEQIMPIL